MGSPDWHEPLFDIHLEEPCGRAVLDMPESKEVAEQIDCAVLDMPESKEVAEQIDCTVLDMPGSTP